MTPTDIEKMKTLLLRCKKALVLNNNIKSIGLSHIRKLLVNNISYNQSDQRFDLIIVDSDDTDVRLDSLQHDIADDCTIFVCNYKETANKKINTFIQNNLNNIQTSRQMLINGAREQSLTIKYNKQKASGDRSDPISIFLVLKTGGVYDYKYVNTTAKNIRNNITYEHEIVCLTDSGAGIDSVDRIVKFKHQYPKWWGKVELFRNDLTKNNHCLFFDLDTVIVDNVNDLCKLPKPFYGIRDFFNLNVLQTGLMKWENGAVTHLYNNFVKEDFSKYKDKGDHEWVGKNVKEPNYIQDCLPGQICSYKKHLAHLSKGLLRPSVICFHGDPRPHTVKDTFITDNWKYI